MRILVAGGAGYIGSHAVRECSRLGHEPVIFDNYSSGNPQAVDGLELVSGDLLDPRSLRSVFETFAIDAVLQLASAYRAPANLDNPVHYYRNNVAGTLNLVHAMLSAGVERLVYLSTAAVYGLPAEVPIPEQHECRPITTHGRSQRRVEEMLAEIAKHQGLRHVTLRCFTAAGADQAGDIGEDRRDALQLIPSLLLAALGRRKKFSIFGTDYDTPDGTCIRDFVHVSDVARALLLALDRTDTCAGRVFNLGGGEGYSVREVLQEAQQLFGASIAIEVLGRRSGDVPVQVAACDAAREALDWTPRESDLRNILETAWAWHRRHPSGYGSAAPSDTAQSDQNTKLFGDIACRLGYVSQEDVQRALERQEREMQLGNQHKLIGMHMLEMGILSISQLIEILKYYEER